jgi:hypothetical protein
MDESLKIAKDYLIAATAKDCSLMISFRPMKDGAFGSPHVYLQSTNQSFNYKVHFNIFHVYFDVHGKYQITWRPTISLFCLNIMKLETK